MRYGSNIRLAGILFTILGGLFSSTSQAQTAPKLRYGFQKGQECWYDVKIAADLSAQQVTFEGTLTYTVNSATPDDFVLQCSGLLSRSLKQNFDDSPWNRSYGPPLRLSPLYYTLSSNLGMRSVRGSSMEGTTFDRHGGIANLGNKSYLPLLLGYEIELIVEKLPKEEKSYWENHRDVAVIERDSIGPILRPLGPVAAFETYRVAREKIDYSIIDQKADTIRIDKKYSLKTVEEGGITHLEMSGKGEFEFDSKEGVIRSESMKYEIRVNEKNVTATIPFTLTYRMKTPAELVEFKKKLEEDRKAAEARLEAEKPKPFQPGEREKLLKDLESGDNERIQTASKRLARVQPVENPEDISRALCQAFKKSNEQVQADILRALKLWAAAEAEQTVIEATKSRNFILQHEAVSVLGQFKTATSAKAAAALLFRNRMEAANALKAIGPVAEPFVILLLKDRDPMVRNEAANILAEIGGKKSLSLLKEELLSVPGYHKHNFETAIAAIERRLAFEQNSSEPEAVDSAKQAAAEPKLRTWSDSTGTYKVEASFVKSESDKVTIKKADGKNITLSVKKLSQADQEYVEQQTKAQANKPENPFE